MQWLRTGDASRKRLAQADTKERGQTTMLVRFIDKSQI